jgi:hypothetical protein
MVTGKGVSLRPATESKRRIWYLSRTFDFFNDRFSKNSNGR